MSHYLVTDDDGGVDGAAHQGLADDVEVGLGGSGGVTHGDPHVHQTRELLLEALDGLRETLELLDLYLGLLLVHINNLEFIPVSLEPLLDSLEELQLPLLDDVPGDGPELGVLPDLVGGPGAHGLTIDIHIRLLSDIKPDDGAVLENIQIISWTEAEIVSGSPWGRCSRRPCPRQPQIQPVWADRSSRPCIQELDGSWDIRE